MRVQRTLIVELLLVSVMLIWGMNFSVVKLLYAHFHPLAFNALRFTVTSITMVAVLQVRGESLRIDRSDLPAVVGLAVTSNTIYQFLFVLGLDRTRAGNAGLLMSLAPIFAYLTGIFLKRERFHVRLLGGILLSTGGVLALVLLGTNEVDFGGTWAGDLMILGATLCWGLFTGSARSMILKYGALRITILTMLIGTALMVPISLPWVIEQDWGSISLRAWAAFAYATFLAIVFSYFAWSYALSKIGVARTAIFSNLMPVVALLGAWMLLGERPGLGQGLGVALILTGVFLVRSHEPIPKMIPAGSKDSHDGL